MQLQVVSRRSRPRFPFGRHFQTTPERTACRRSNLTDTPALHITPFHRNLSVSINSRLRFLKRPLVLEHLPSAALRRVNRLDARALPAIIPICRHHSRRSKADEGWVSFPLRTTHARQNCVRKAHELRGQQKIDAIFMEGTTAVFYSSWNALGQSERTFWVIIPCCRKNWRTLIPGLKIPRARIMEPVFGEEIRVLAGHEESVRSDLLESMKDRGNQNVALVLKNAYCFSLPMVFRKAA